MRLDILWRGGGGLGEGVGGILICSLLLGTALGTKIHDTLLDKREPQGPPPPPMTVWVTVNAQGGWMATEFSTMTITITPTGLPGPTSIATVTSTITTATTVTNTVTAKSTTTQTNTQTGTTQPTATSTAVVTDKPTVTTTKGFAAAPTTTNLTETWAQGAPVVRRQVPETVTSTTTLWNWAYGTTTSIITVTAQATPSLNNFLVQTSVVLLTTTLTKTQVSTFTTEQIVTASTSPSPTKLVVDGADPLSSQPNITTAKTPNVEIIVGASFGALVGFIGIFVLAYLYAKKRRDENLRKESVGFSTQGFSRSTPAAGAGVIGMFGSLRRGSSAARYNNLPTTEAIPNMSPLPLPPPPRSPPPQLPSLHVSPPSGEFNYDYTFGSPVSSIDEAQLHALTSGSTINRVNTPPIESPAAPDTLNYTVSRQSEEPSWRTRAVVAETVVTETVVSSVSAESERVGSLRRKPLPGDDLVSP